VGHRDDDIVTGVEALPGYDADRPSLRTREVRVQKRRDVNLAALQLSSLCAGLFDAVVHAVLV
jgi:hypothetical protein